MSGAGKVVCVTGASGYIASYLVKLLLHHGYTVKASVRDPSDPRKIEHLVSLDGAKERLHLYKADLLEEGSFDSIVDGCEGVFHTASPVLLSPTDPKTELLDPAVKGTINVLRSCTKVSSLKRVVLTSSITTTVFSGKPLTPDVLVDETWVSDPVFCEQSKLWYVLSKILAEEAASKFAKENGIDLVTLNPGFVIGPMLQPTLNVTAEIIMNQINGISQQLIFQDIENNLIFSSLAAGSQTFADSVYRFVDIRDVVLAHIQAFEVPSASGRYCVVGHVVPISEALLIIGQLYPTLNIPKKSVDEKPAVYQISKEKAKALGINFTSLEVSLRDTVESLREKGFLKF
ncbi:phenylacetaldehyde reductase-like isoform X1 [Humulus lupulus]|uniref:phenylacetaldehyde reductase-like isoform X1 n=1 Tax=Humulus lupulus TaxID=3486 RepID=UPI002B40A796|nr:phenylacetaldehyde reductase-like isoform X1 [Humulus lupulus]